MCAGCGLCFIYLTVYSTISRPFNKFIFLLLKPGNSFLIRFFHLFLDSEDETEDIENENDGEKSENKQHGLADVMSKILNKNVPKHKKTILLKAKTERELRKLRKAKRGDDSDDEADYIDVFEKLEKVCVYVYICRYM